jgi:heme acquisition protein HasA
MTVTIKYQNQFSDATLSSYIKSLVAINGDITTQLQAINKDYGIFSGNTNSTRSGGDKLSIGSSHGAYTGMVFEGDLNYAYMHQHIFFGNMDSLELGEDLIYIFNGTDRRLENVQLKLSGLDITGEFYPQKSKAENQQNEVHQVISGLMRGNAEPLLEILQIRGIEINMPLKDMAIATQFETISDIIIDTMGAAVEYDATILMAI